MRVTIEKAVYGGAGLGRADGKAVFVPMTLPGETAEVAPVRDRGSFAEASLVSLVEPSAERVEAPCPFYGSCGGCQYQHAVYGAQLGMKRAILEETLGRAGLRDLPEIETHAAEPWGYRNRIRLHVDPVTHALGYRKRGSHALLPVDRCPIAAPLLEEALPRAAAVLAAQLAGAWCAELELFTNGHSSELLVSARQRAGLRSDKAAFMRLGEELRAALPQLRGAGLFQQPSAGASDRRGRRGRSPASDADAEDAGGLPVARWGDGALRYQVGSGSYQVSLGAFFQGNRFLLERLAALVTEGAQGELAWDLFAGVGLFAGGLARNFVQVVAVEGSPVSAEDLRRNLPGSPVVSSSVMAFLQRQRRRGAAPDLVVLDPPRAGLGVEAARLLAATGSREVTYVSCDPATLARDLRALVDAGYTITHLHLIDMFPQTFHLETVARLRRS